MIFRFTRAHSITTAVVVCFSLCSGIVSAVGAALQQNSRPFITATPERVTFKNGSGSTKIDWNTGNGSRGFIFVTEDGGQPLLFAIGRRGSKVVPWIGSHRYAFELY